MSLELVKMDDFRTPEGSVRWRDYETAKVANGESCRQCGKYLLGIKGYPTLCIPCDRLADDESEVSHANAIRCPMCNHVITDMHDFINDSEKREAYTDGGCEIDCPECEGEFSIRIHTAYTFHSPAKGEKECL